MKININPIFSKQKEFSTSQSYQDTFVNFFQILEILSIRLRCAKNELSESSLFTLVDERKEKLLPVEIRK